jgi:hypothetical protein
MLYNVLMHKYKFGQAHCVELLKGVAACCAQWPDSRVGLGLAARYSGESGMLRCVTTRAPGALTVWSPRAVRARDGALAGGPVAASRWQGATGELAGVTGRTPGKVVGGGAHPSSGAVWRQWRASGSGVQRWGDSSDDRWRWRRVPAVSGRKREGEVHDNWEPRRTEEWHTEEVETDVGGGSDSRR